MICISFVCAGWSNNGNIELARLPFLVTAIGTGSHVPAARFAGRWVMDPGTKIVFPRNIEYHCFGN